MKLWIGLCAFSIVASAVASLAQDITDVEAKPYGSYTGGPIDTVDLATGNLMLNIPLISFPQRGALPPLLFSVELNNAPYSQVSYIDPTNPNAHCITSRYDTSPPGAAFQYVPYYIGANPAGGCAYQTGAILQNLGAYLTSSYEGGVVTGQFNYTASGGGDGSGGGSLEYSAIDPSGTTHKLESDASSPPSSWNTYRAVDGSGYTFVPSEPTPSNSCGLGHAYDPEDPENAGLGSATETCSVNYWIANANNAFSGLRLGTLYSPTGIQYTNTIVSFPTPSYNQTEAAINEWYVPRALISTVKDPSGNNSVTRGPWYWSGYYSNAPTTSSPPFGDIQGFYATNPPRYLDSVGRSIPDIVAMQSTMLGSSLTWNVPGQNGATLQYTIHYVPMGNSPSSTLTMDPATDVSVSGWAIHSIVLPNLTQWVFSYNSTGDLQQVQTPGGGTISYQYSYLPYAAMPIGLSRCNAVCHVVQQRTETDGVGPPRNTYYSYAVLTSLSNCPLATGPSGPPFLVAVSTTETDDSGNDTVHYFCAVGARPGAVANQFHEIRTEYYQGCLAAETGCNISSGRTLLKTVTTNYEYQWDLNAVDATTDAGMIDVLPTQVTTTTPSGLSSIETMQYSGDSVSNGSRLASTTEIGCGLDATGPGNCVYTGHTWQGSTNPVQVSYLSPTTDTVTSGLGNVSPHITKTSFLFQSGLTPYQAANVVSLPVSEEISSGITGGFYGTTTYGYDENNGSSQGAFGNQTSKTETYYLSGSNNTNGLTTVETQAVYNTNGMPITTIDANGNSTTITYDGTGLFANETQRPMTNGVAHIDYYSYDMDTGNLNWHTDENGSGPNDSGHTTTYTHDLMGRVTAIQYPGGGGSTFCYTDLGGSLCQQGTAPFSLYTSTTAYPDPAIQTVHTYDGWGRQFKSVVSSDPLGPTVVDTTYDYEGRVASVSSPYRTLTDPTYGKTYYTYDALGRKTIQTQPDGKTQQWCYDGIPSTSQTNCLPKQNDLGFGLLSWTDVADETGRHSQQQFDVFGNMTAVSEPDPALGSLALETDYAYDLFNDLSTVNQLGTSGGSPVARSFYYDMPSRVTGAYNPEAGYISYWYDGDSNLVQRVDARNLVTSYTYDALNRLTSKVYSGPQQWYELGGGTYSATPTVCFTYDSSATTNGVGKLAAEWTQNWLGWFGPTCSNSTWDLLTKNIYTAYDPMGRLLSENRCMGAVNCSHGGRNLGYTYDLAGKLTSTANGFDGKGFLTAYDGAGRVQNMVDGTNPYQTTTLFSVPSYTPAGALSGVQLGASLSVSRTFDVRQRVRSETDSTISGANTPGSATVIISGSEQAK
jgi:YD repeat-containing protein